MLLSKMISSDWVKFVFDSGSMNSSTFVVSTDAQKAYRARAELTRLRKEDFGTLELVVKFQMLMY